MRGLGIILSGTLAAGVAWGGSVGYLPRIGPANLRFQPLRPVVPVILPPLVMQDPVPVITEAPASTDRQPAEPSSAMLVPSPLTPAPELSASPTNQLDETSISAGSPMPVVSNENNTFLSPQAFLRFFTGSRPGAGREVVVAVPPGFNPAQPGQPVVSSATYTGPKP